MKLFDECIKSLKGNSSTIVQCKGHHVRITSSPDNPTDEAIVDRSPYSKDNLILGDFLSIAIRVKFMLGENHNPRRVTTYLNFCINEKPSILDIGGMYGNGDIVVGNDVWIGQDATIMSGVTIGTGAVIAAGSVVTKDIEPYTIVGGIPAKPIRKRFDNKTIVRLLKSKWWELSNKTLKKHSNLLFSEDVDKFLEVIETNSK